MECFNQIKADLLHIINTHKQVVNSDKTSGVYMIYISCDFDYLNVLPFCIEKSQGIGPHWITQRNRIKKYFNGEHLSESPLDNIVFYRLKKFIDDYYKASGRLLTVDDIHAVCLSTDVSPTSLDEIEAYWTSRLKSEMTSVSHCLFVKTLRRIENKILYSKDAEESKNLIEINLLNAYKYGSEYLNNALIYKELMDNNNYAQENLKLLAYYVYKKLPYIEDDEFIHLDKINQAKSLFYSLVNKYFNVN